MCDWGGGGGGTALYKCGKGSATHMGFTLFGADVLLLRIWEENKNICLERGKYLFHGI